MSELCHAAASDIKGRLASNRPKEAACHRRRRPRAGFPRFDQLSRDAQQFGKETLAKTQMVSELVYGGGAELRRIGNLHGFHRQLAGSASKAVANFSQALNQQITQSVFRRLAHNNNCLSSATDPVRI